jgi:hypothetical protein
VRNLLGSAILKMSCTCRAQIFTTVLTTLGLPYVSVSFSHSVRNTSVADPDSESSTFWTPDPGTGMETNPDPGGKSSVRGLSTIFFC